MRMRAVGAVSLPILLEDLIQPPLVVVLGFPNAVGGRGHRLSEEFDRSRGQVSNAQIEFGNVRLRRLEW